MSLALLLLAAVCPTAAPLPEGDAYVRGLLTAESRHEEALSRYTYDMSEVTDDLDATGGVRRRRTRELEVFMVKGRPLRRVVARNGQPLTGAEREKEERRVRELAEAIAAGRATAELPGVRLAKLLERYHFAAVSREELGGRCVIAFDVEALPGDFALDHDSALKRLAGRLWVDEQDQAVAKIEVDNSSGIKIGLGFAARLSRVALRAEFTRLEDGVWLPRSAETLVVGRKLLVSAIRVRRTQSYGHYRRFEVQVHEELKREGSPKPDPPREP